MPKIPISKPYLDINDQTKLFNTFKSSWISSNGKNINEFENKFSEYTGSNHSLCCANGTLAIELALKSLGIKKNDEVIVPNLTFAATVNAVLNVGAKPIIIDIEKDSFAFKYSALEKFISNKTFAIIYVHLYGFPIDIKKNLGKLYDRNIYLIEDCAEALGTFIKNKHIGLFGDCSTFSFFSNKIITSGEGGMINFKKKKNYDLAFKIKNQGRSNQKYYWHDEIGGNYRMTNLQASLGITQLKKINRLLKIRKKIFQAYDAILNNSEKIMPIHNIIDCNFNDISYWYYTIQIKEFSLNKRDKLIQYLKKSGIETRPMFYPLSDMPIYKSFLLGSSVNSKNWSYSSLSLPTFPGLKINEIEYVCKKIKLFIK